MEMLLTLKIKNYKIFDLDFLAKNKSLLTTYRYGKKMHNPKTLLLTDNAMEASKISKLLYSWGYAVKSMGFLNEALFNGNFLKHDIILIDLPIKDNGNWKKSFETLKNDVDLPVVCTASIGDYKSLDIPESFFCLEKPVDQKELKLTMEMAIYKNRMEKALDESERRYKQLVENADDPIVVVKNDGTFLLVNKSGARYFGGVPEDFNNKNMWDVFPKPIADSQMRSVIDVIESGEGSVKEEKILVKNEERWFSTKIQPITDSDGSTSSVQLIARDITAQKVVEKDLTDRENFFSGTLNDMQSFVAVLKPTGEIIFVNNTPLELVGKKLEDVEGVLFSETPWWDYSEEVKASLEEDIKLCASGKSLAHEIQINTLNGLIWIDFSMHPVYDALGNVKYLVPEGRDISNIKKTKKALQIEKNRFMSLTENAPYGMVLIDKNGIYKYINTKFREMFGYNLNDIPNGREWFQRAFRDPEKRQEAISTWKNDFKDALPGEKRPRTYTVTCKNDEEKIIDFLPVLLENNEYLMTVEDITERKIAENALQKSEERFRTVASSAVDAIIITDLNGSIVFCNSSLQKIFGYHEHDILGKSVNMLMPGRYKDEFKRKQEQFKLTGRHTLSGKLFESYGHRKDGSEFPIEISITAWEVGGDRFTTSIIRDITERKLVEYELKSSEEKFRQMTENIEEVFWIIDPKMSQLLYISPAYQKVWGCSRESLFDNPRSWIESIHAEDRKQVIDVIFRTPNQVRAEGKNGIEYRIRRPDGTIRWIWGKAFPLRHGENKIHRIAGLAVDITQRKKAEEDYRNLFENINVGVYRSTLGTQSKLVDANPALLEMFGYKKTEILAIKASYLYQESHDKIRFDHKMMKYGRVKNQELNFKKKDGTPFTASVSAFVVKDDSGNITYYDAVIQDITKIKELEKNIKNIDPIPLPR
jgi:two-component system, sporulation sensor kinase E